MTSDNLVKPKYDLPQDEVMRGFFVQSHTKTHIKLDIFECDSPLASDNPRREKDISWPIWAMFDTMAEGRQI